MKRILFASLLIILSLNLRAQSVTVKGKVTDNQSTPLGNAEVKVLDRDETTYTDKAGNFEITVNKNGHSGIAVSLAGYTTVWKTAPASADALIIVLQQGSRQLKEVTVTARKNYEQSQEVPISLSVFDRQYIKDARLHNLRELTAIVPNLYSANPGDGRNVTSIRGIATTSYDQTVATYIDGVNQFSLDTYIPQLLDVERIEVLRGPQGTLYGRNAMAGVINVITRQPSNYTKGFAEVEFGRFGERRLEFGVQTPVAKNLFMGLSGLISGTDGYYKNLYNSTHYDLNSTVLGNYYLKYYPSADWALTLNLKGSANRNNGAFTLAGSVDDALSKPYTVNQNSITKMIDNTYNASFSAVHTGSAVDFSSSTAYQYNKRYYTVPIDGDFSPMDIFAVDNNFGGAWNKNEALTQEFILRSHQAADRKFNFTTGSYLFYQNNPVKQGSDYGADGAIYGAPANSSTVATNKQTGAGVAFFGNVSYALTTQLTVNAGIRYDYEHKHNDIEGEFHMGDFTQVTQADTAASANFHALSPSAGLAYAINDNHRLFFNYSRGFRAGGISQLGADPNQIPLLAYQPEYSNSFELTTKNTFFNDRLKVNATVFYTRVTNAQVPTVILPDAITIVRNTGKLRSRGAELELTAVLNKNFELEHALGLTNAVFTDLNLASDNSQSLTGKHQVYTPDATVMFALRYGGNISKTLRLTGRAEWKYTGDQCFDLQNQIEQKGYSLLKARIGVATKTYGIYLWANNLTNKKYIDYAYDFGAAHLGMPVTYGATLNVNF